MPSARLRPLRSRVTPPWAAILAIFALSAGLPPACGVNRGATQKAQQQQIQAFPALELDETVEGEHLLHLDLGADDTLIVDHSFGEVEVRASADTSPRALAVIEVSAVREKTATRILEQSRLTAHRTEAGLVLHLDQPERPTVPSPEGEEGRPFVSSAALTIDVPPGTRLAITTVRGDVTVQGPLGATRIVTGQGHIRMRRVEGGAIAETTVGDIKLRQIHGGPIRAETAFGMVGLLGADADSIRLTSGNGRIVVDDARAEALEIRSGEGEIKLTEIEADIDAATDSGPVSLTAASGRTMRLATGFGSLEVHDAHALALTASADRGELTVERVTADTLDLSTGTGGMVLTDLEGALTARTGSGAIDAERLTGTHLRLDSGLDGVHVQGAVGQLEVASRKGRIVAKDVEGGLRAASEIGAIRATGIFDDLQLASGSGKLEVEAHAGSRVIDPWSLRADFGDVILTLPRPFAFQLAAHTGTGAMDSEFPILIEAGVVTDAGRFTGQVAGGGGKIEIETVQGSIALRRGGD